MSVRWFVTALERCRAVARIEDELGEGVGTGFLVEGRSLGLGLPPKVLVTNSHVVSVERWERALHPDEARVAFRALDERGDTFAISELVWSSPPTALDVSILALETLPEDATPCPVAKAMPLLDSPVLPRAYVIGHPQGAQEPRLSIHGTVLIALDDTVLHYRSPTEPGSSGSPVFNREWKVIGVHHRYDERLRRMPGRTGTYTANEGICVDRIRQALSES